MYVPVQHASHNQDQVVAIKDIIENEPIVREEVMATLPLPLLAP